MGMSTPVKQEKQDKTEDVFKKLAELKRSKIKGQMIIYLDGSGMVPKAEVHQFI